MKMVSGLYGSAHCVSGLCGRSKEHKSKTKSIIAMTSMTMISIARLVERLCPITLQQSLKPQPIRPPENSPHKERIVDIVKNYIIPTTPYSLTLGSHPY